MVGRSSFERELYRRTGDSTFMMCFSVLRGKLQRFMELLSLEPFRAL